MWISISLSRTPDTTTSSPHHLKPHFLPHGPLEVGGVLVEKLGVKNNQH
jgi:hypothetical protein